MNSLSNQNINKVESEKIVLHVVTPYYVQSQHKLLNSFLKTYNNPENLFIIVVKQPVCIIYLFYNTKNDPEKNQGF